MTSGEMREEAERIGRRGISARRAKSRWSGLRVILLLALCCVVSAGAGILSSYKSASREPKGGLVYEVNVVSGDIPGKSREEHQWETDSMVEEGMFAMSMNITPSGRVSDGRMINWLTESPSNRGKLIRVEITRDDIGEKTYETGAICPGNYVEPALFNMELSAGIYKYTAVFPVYREGTEALIRQVTVKITLILQE